MLFITPQKQAFGDLNATAKLPRFLVALPLFFCLAAFFLIPVRAFACAGEALPELLYMSFWRSDLLAPQDRNFLTFSYGDLVSHFPPEEVNDDSNIADWKALGNFNDADVKSFVYSSTPEQLEAFKKALEAKKSYTGIAGAIPKYIESQNEIAIVDYMLFAKSVSKIFPKSADPYSSDEDSWKYSKVPNKESLALAQTAEKEMKEAKTPFLKLRYAYQAMRLYRARLEHSQNVKFFEEFVAPINTTSEVKEWCRSFYAGSLYWTKEYPKAFLEFSKTFQNSSRYRSASYTGARWILRNQANIPIRNDLIKKALDMAKTKEERSAVLVMACYMRNLVSTFFDNTKAQPIDNYLALLLKDIKTGAVDLPTDLPLLVSWEINSAEVNIFNLTASTTYEFNYTLPALPAPKKNSDEYKNSMETLSELQPLLADINDKVPSPAFYLASQSYIAFLRGENGDAKKLLEAADKANGADAAGVKSQLQVLHMAYNAATLPLNNTGEATLEKDYIDMQKVFSALPPEPGNGQNQNEAQIAKDFTKLSERSWLKASIIHIWSHILPARYEAEGKSSQKALCFARADKLGTRDSYPAPLAFRTINSFNSKQIKELKKVLASPEGDLQKSLVAGFIKNYPADFLNELEATINIREHNFAEAAEIMSTIPAGTSNYRQTTYRQPEDDVTFKFNNDSPKRNPFKEPLAFGGKEYTSSTTDHFSEYTFAADPLKDKSPILPDLAAEIERLKKEVNSTASASTPINPADKENILKKIALCTSANNGFKSKHPDKYVFASTMAALKELSTEKGELGAKSMYAYAKGLVNTSYVGNNRYLYTWNRSGAELWMYNYSKGDGSKDTKIATPKDYYENDSAREAFIKAADMSSDPELKARALFMASFTMQTTKELYTNDEKLGDYFKNNPYLKKLKADLSNTEFYRVAFKSCSYLRDFDKVK